MLNENYGDESVSFSMDNEIGSAITIGSPNDELCPDKIYVSACTPKLNSYKSSNSIATFDINFEVTIRCEDGTHSNYTVTKRIGVDKCKLAEEAMRDCPVTIVESKSTSKIEKTGKYLTTENARKLAGLI